MAVTLSIKVNGTEKASQDIPVLPLQVLLEDILPDGGTQVEQAEAVLAWLVQQGRDALSDDTPGIGSRPYDVMLAAVAAVDPTWDHSKVVDEGMLALVAAYEAL